MGTKTLLSLEEFMALPDDGPMYEYYQGQLVVIPPPISEHSLVCQRVNRLLSTHVYRARIGHVFNGAGYLLKRDPEVTVRRVDVSFLSASRVKETPADEYFAGSPELAVEVVSPGNEAEELEVKVKQYLTYGSKEVWVVYPKTRTLQIRKPDGNDCTLAETGTITSDLLPGWTARVADFFDLYY